MPVTFHTLVKDERFRIRNRRSLSQFYAEVRGAVREGRLHLEGHSLPITLNELLTELFPDEKLLKKDVDMVNFSLAEDEALREWCAQRFAPKPQGQPVYMSEGKRSLLERVQALQAAKEESFLRGSAKKEDVVSALSDLQAAVDEFLSLYDREGGALKLPPRDLALERVKVRGAKASP